MDRRTFLHALGRWSRAGTVAAGGAALGLTSGCGGEAAPAAAEGAAGAHTAPGGQDADAEAATGATDAAAGSDAATRGANVHEVTLAVDPGAAGVPINPALLGSNVQWCDGGDGLLRPDGSPQPAMQAAAGALGPTVLRYPGGTQADAFHWDAPQNLHVFADVMQPTLMDTRRLLELCEQWGATAMCQVNLVTGTPDEAARWVRQANVDGLVSSRTGRRLPAVPRWELGNEPYLQNARRPDLDLTPAQFASQVNAFIPALKAVDPTVRLGLPLTTDRRNGVWVTPYQGFTAGVLAAVDQPFDFACVHDAYMPYVTDGMSDPRTLYYGAMAGALAVQDDLAAMRALLAAARPGRTIPLALTEWAPLFSMDGAPTDALLLSPAGALYAVDLLRMLATQPDIECANHWSLTGNWWFGAVSQSATNRAVADAVALARPALAGSRLPASVRCDTLATPALGQMAARDAMPLLECLVSRSGATVRVLLVHKDLDRRAQVALDLGGVAPLAATLTALRSADPFADADTAGLMTRVTSHPAPGATMNFWLAPHSVAVLELTMPG